MKYPSAILKTSMFAAFASLTALSTALGAQAQNSAAPDKAAVDAFHAAGIANGGTDEGAPGNRAGAPGNPYGAYLRDPVGNKICAFAPPEA